MKKFQKQMLTKRQMNEVKGGYYLCSCGLSNARKPATWFFADTLQEAYDKALVECDGAATCTPVNLT